MVMSRARCLRLPVARNRAATSAGLRISGSLRPVFWYGRWRTSQVFLSHLAIEEAERADHLVEVGPRDVAVPGEVQLEVADNVADAAHIAVAGTCAVPSEAKLVVHAIAELAHDVLLSE